MLVYDCQRSLQVYLLEKADPPLFQRLKDAMERDGYKGLKMYRWARRTGSSELSICLDNPPKEDIIW